MRILAFMFSSKRALCYTLLAGARDKVNNEGGRVSHMSRGAEAFGFITVREFIFSPSWRLQTQAFQRL